MSAATSGSALCLCLTTESADAAEALARRLVEERICACVSRVPVASTYRWQGVVEDSPEVLLVMKTAASRVSRLRARVEELSTYDVPEFVVLDVAQASEPYARWLLDACDADS